VVTCIGYELDRKDSPGFPVDLSSTLESQKTLDFVLVKNLGKSKDIQLIHVVAVMQSEKHL